jgi:glutathione synthase/RimK-type ligase-like ATP-grasp enzyme
MIVQKYINIGQTPESYRVLTVLGDAVYCAKYISNVNLSSVSQEQLTSGVSVAANVDDRRMELADDPDIVELAKRVHQTLNCTPVMGVDVAREKDTGRLYVLELNSAGMTWHLSSDRGKGAQRKFSLNLYDQFNALKVITDRLILQTRLMTK